MSQGRPQILFPLFADLTGLPGVGAKTAKLFEKIGATRVIDLVLTLPHGVEDRRLRDSLIGIEPGAMATVAIEVLEHRPGRTATQPYRIVVQGGGVQFELIYFRARRDWLERSLPVGGHRVVSGRVEFYDGRLQMPHPDHVLNEAEASTLRDWEPVYPLTQGLTQRMVARAVAGAVEKVPELPEWIEPSVLGDRKWPAWDTAIRLAHNPPGTSALSPGNPARQRLSYDELLSHQLALQVVRVRMKRGRGQANRGDGSLRDRALAAFGHPPTGAQTRAMAEIAGDMAEPTRMMRLLQGDVGAGKTLVALIAMLTAGRPPSWRRPRSWPASTPPG